jgi:hemoglobin
VLFGDPVYFNNPLAIHQKLHHRSPLESDHFDRCVGIFCETVDDLFVGPMAKAAKLCARAIAGSLDQRLHGGVRIARS